MMKKTIGMLLLLCLPLSMQAQLFNEDAYQITRMTNLSNEVSKVDSEGFSMCGLCFAHFDKGDIIFLNITIGTTTPYDFDEGHSSLMLVFLEDQVKRLPIKPENILELTSFTHPEQANGIWVVNCSIRLSLAQLEYLSHHPLSQLYVNFKHGQAGMGLCYQLQNNEGESIQKQAAHLFNALQ